MLDAVPLGILGYLELLPSNAARRNLVAEDVKRRSHLPGVETEDEKSDTHSRHHSSRDRFFHQYSSLAKLPKAAD